MAEKKTGGSKRTGGESRKKKDEAAAKKAADAASKRERDLAKRAKGAGKKMTKDVRAKQAAKKPAAAAPAKPAEKAEKAEPDGPEHAVKIKPTLTVSVARALQVRASRKGHEPAFRRQEWWRYKKLSRSGWRKPFGLHSKMRRHFGYRPNVPSAGFGSPREARGLHPSGFREVLVHTPGQVDGIDPATHAVRIGGSVGTKKREAIVKACREKKIRVLNAGGIQ